MTKEFQIEKEEKLSLLADDMVHYIENLNEATRLLELIKEYEKVVEYKIYIQICCISIHKWWNYKKEKLKRNKILLIAASKEQNTEE